VRIADIGLDAEVLSVGVDEAHQFDVPAAESVGWYKYGSAPGGAGSTVLAAHVDFGGQPGAFFNLADVEPGDTLEVELANGASLQYLVIDNVLYDKTELPADELFRRSGAPVLQLITCGGTFDPDRRSYRGNVVVTAVPVEA
jgi:sortase (surface protein transpeptidase)